MAPSLGWPTNREIPPWTKANLQSPECFMVSIEELSALRTTLFINQIDNKHFASSHCRTDRREMVFFLHLIITYCTYYGQRGLALWDRR